MLNSIVLDIVIGLVFIYTKEEHTSNKTLHNKQLEDSLVFVNKVNQRSKL